MLTFLPIAFRPINYHADAIKAQGGFREDLKPINITQPEVF
jgi:primary-amine oxidase